MKISVLKPNTSSNRFLCKNTWDYISLEARVFDEKLHFGKNVKNGQKLGIKLSLNHQRTFAQKSIGRGLGTSKPILILHFPKKPGNENVSGWSGGIFGYAFCYKIPLSCNKL